ncbi:hypothetical protein JCM10212_000260 [Sporobolomyces blumeae]
MAAVMPLIAQTFVDSRTNTAFEIVAASRDHSTSSTTTTTTTRSPRTLQDKGPSVVSSPTPSSASKGKVATRRRRSSKPGRDVPTDVHNWTDEVLAERYRFVEEIGYGNWGSVWKCRPKDGAGSDKTLALKLVHRSKSTTSSARVRALWQEYKCIRALRAIQHPNLIAFHSFIITPSYCLVSMDFHPRLMAVALPETKAKTYFRQLLSAVEHLHVHGITHNDIKPSNVLLAADDRPVLVDFGFAQQWNVASPDRFLSSLSWGTPEYLSCERAKGLLHDERLSDVWALGVTMYEIVVGRTPFEQSDNEEFLNREQLEVYYHRTTTGRFYGDYAVSTEFEALVRLMVEPRPHLRLQSCGGALRHPFFDVPQTPKSKRHPQLSSSANAQSSSRQVTPVSNKTRTPTQTPKPKVEKGFRIFEDVEEPSSARTGGSVSPFSPRPLTLVDRSNHSPSTTTTTVTAKPAPATKAIPLAFAKTPPASKIPVRRTDAARSTPCVKSPTGRSRTVSSKRIDSIPPVPVPPIPLEIVARAQASVVPRPDSAPSETVPPPVRTTSLHGRSNSVSSVKRKPVPPLLDTSFTPGEISWSSEVTASFCSPSSPSGAVETLASNQTSPVSLAAKESFSDLGSPPKSPGLLATFSRKISVLKSSPTKRADDGSRAAVPAAPSPGPSLRKASIALNSRMRKLSMPLKAVRQSRSSAMVSLAGLKRSIATGLGRRASLTDSLFSIVEPEIFTDSHSITMPVRLRPAAVVDAEAQKARMAAFSAHVQHILDSRKVVDPAFASESSRSPTQHASSADVDGSEAQGQAFSFNGTSSLTSTPISNAPSPRPNGGCRATPETARGKAGSVATRKSPPSVPEYRPGHRRIPTNIRNVPSVVLHESADDEDFASESEVSRAETPAERIASPPPPPRVVEPPRQLPTWVPTGSDDDSDSDENMADIDEPTITLATPTKASKAASHRASRSSTLRKSKKSSASPRKSLKKSSPHISHAREDSIVSLEAQRFDRPVFSRNNTATTFSTTTSVSTCARPVTPNPADLPFTDLDLRADSRASTAYSSHGGHSRSRSVISFFTRSVSRASNASSLGWSTSSENPHAVEAEKPKKCGRLRRAVSKVFR